MTPTHAASPEETGSIDHSTQPASAVPAKSAVRIHSTRMQRLYDRVEAFVSRLSMRDNFWNGICSLVWLPLAFFSGIRMKELDQNSFVARAVLPFRRFNRNWYRAMAGGALLANSEIASGSYVFGICGSNYTVVCKHLSYTFLRPCFGPAVFRIQARDDIKQLMASGREFNIDLDIEVQQQGKPGEKDRRVGKCEATFHVTPKVHHKIKRARQSLSTNDRIPLTNE